MFDFVNAQPSATRFIRSDRRVGGKTRSSGQLWFVMLSETTLQLGSKDL